MLEQLEQEEPVIIQTTEDAIEFLKDLGNLQPKSATHARNRKCIAHGLWLIEE